MPSPSTCKLLVPISWDDFENICADLLERLWVDPYLVRHGRSGQRQQGVDIYGCPKHLNGVGSKIYAGAQCKNTPNLAFKAIKAEIEKAGDFEPKLQEYVVMTSTNSDSKLQHSIRNHSWKFPVYLLCWEDISLRLASHPDLLAKHYPGFIPWETRQSEDGSIQVGFIRQGQGGRGGDGGLSFMGLGGRGGESTGQGGGAGGGGGVIGGGRGGKGGRGSGGSGGGGGSVIGDGQGGDGGDGQ